MRGINFQSWNLWAMAWEMGKKLFLFLPPARHQVTLRKFAICKVSILFTLFNLQFLFERGKITQ